MVGVLPFGHGFVADLSDFRYQSASSMDVGLCVWVSCVILYSTERNFVLREA